MAHPLKAYRGRLGLGVTEFARQAGTTRQTIHRIESGRMIPSLSMIARIRDVTNGAVRADDFLIGAALPHSTAPVARDGLNNAARPASPFADPAAVPSRGR